MSRALVCLPFAVALLTAASLVLAAPVPKPSPEKVRKELERLWQDLLSKDERIASRATLGFAAYPEDAVALLKEKLRPLVLSKERLKELLTDLGSGKEKLVRAAFEELSYLDPRLVLNQEGLSQALSDKASGRLVGAVLCDFPQDTFVNRGWHWNSPDNKVYRFAREGSIQDWDIAIRVEDIGTFGQKATWVRALRAIALLEHIGSREAFAIVEDLATGHPDAAPTRAAKAVLECRKK
jgi:hypothetical protein